MGAVLAFRRPEAPVAPAARPRLVVVPKAPPAVPIAPVVFPPVVKDAEPVITKRQAAARLRGARSHQDWVEEHRRDVGQEYGLGYLRHVTVQALKAGILVARLERIAKGESR